MNQETLDKIAHSPEPYLKKIYDKYGHGFEIDYFGPGSVRIWLRNHHIHYSAATHGGFSGQGNTVQEAAEKLLELGEKYFVYSSFHCQEGCPKHKFYLD